MIQFYVEIVKERKRKGGKERYNAVVGYLPIIAETVIWRQKSGPRCSRIVMQCGPVTLR